MKSRKRLSCFDISNFEEVDSQNELALVQIEEQLASIGAPLTKLDSVQKVLCVVFENEDLTVQNVLDMLRHHGFEAKERKEKQDEI